MSHGPFGLGGAVFCAPICCADVSLAKVSVNAKPSMIAAKIVFFTVTYCFFRFQSAFHSKRTPGRASKDNTGFSYASIRPCCFS